MPGSAPAPASARPGDTVTIKAAASFLVCEEICVPEDAVLTLSLPVQDGHLAYLGWVRDAVRAP